MKREKKSLITKWSLIGGATAIVGVGASFLAISLVKLDEIKQRYSELSNFVDNNLNNYSNDVEKNNEFIKGVDISSYCEVIENFLFQKNIRKSDGTFYKYHEVFTNSYQGMTLDEYINQNLFSYFDENGQKVYANLFELLKRYGINSIRIRVWNNPYDENGNSYGGGTNDVNKAIWLIDESQKYGINDFEIIYHYSDFWADPGKQLRPKAWENLSDEELVDALYEFTYKNTKKILTKIDSDTKIAFQVGNEVDNGILWKKKENQGLIRNDSKFNSQLLNKGIEAISNIRNETNNKNIKIGIGLSNNLITINNKTRWLDNVLENDELDTIYISFYYFWRKKQSFEDLYKTIKELNERFPNKDIIIGEVSFAYNGDISPITNDDSYGAIGDKNNWHYSPSEQIKLMYDLMNLLSNTLKNSKTGFYYYEPANIMIGRNSWASKPGLNFYKNAVDTSKWSDINNWARIGFFDTNATALPILEVIKQFKRNIKIDDYNIFDSSEITDNFQSKDMIDKLINKKTNFIFKKDFNKLDLNNLFVKMFENSKIFDGSKNERHINIYKHEYEKENNNIKKTLIEKIKFVYNNIMYTQIEFVDYIYDKNTKTGSIKIKALDKSFYYKNSATITFNVYDDYFDNTIEFISDKPIEIKGNDVNWFKKIVSQLKKQPNWKFENDIYQFLKIKGGANDDNGIWLYDEFRQVDRFSSIFLLKDSKIRNKDNTVNIELLNKNKIWVDKLDEKYKVGETIEINFAIRKEIKGLDEYNDSTFSQIGLESWMYIDLLVYKLKVKII